MKTEKTLFGRMPDGRDVGLLHVDAGNGVQACFCELGASLVSLTLPDKTGAPTDVILGFDALADYLRNKSCHGAVIGRFANRIRGARFALDGVEYRLEARFAGHALHGGKRAFHRVVWRGEPVETADAAGVRFSYLSAHLEDGFPGNLDVTVTYTLAPDGRLAIDYRAVTDRRTHVNLTQHAYFNLGGMRRDALGHEVMINAAAVTEVDRDKIPTGKILDIRGTPHDLSRPIMIGEAIKAAGEGGFDDNYILSRKADGLEFAARAFDPESGIVMETWTTEPAVQFYTGNHLHRERGKNGVRYRRHWGFCLETQHYPDSPNHPEFPSTILEPGGAFQSRTVYQCSVKK